MFGESSCHPSHCYTLSSDTTVSSILCTYLLQWTLTTCMLLIIIICSAIVGGESKPQNLVLFGRTEVIFNCLPVYLSTNLSVSVCFESRPPILYSIYRPASTGVSFSRAPQVTGRRSSPNLNRIRCQQYFKWTLPFVPALVSCDAFQSHLFRGGPSLFIGILDGILLLRVYALYNRSKRGTYKKILWNH